MHQAFVRAVALVAGLVLIVEGCGSAASPPPSPPAANVSQAPASQSAASPAPSAAAASPSPAALPASPSPAASATALPSPAPSPSAATGTGIAGTWNGTWQDKTPDQAGGTFVVTLTQSGNALTGSIVVKGTPCLTSGTVTGAVNGNAISFGAVSGRIQIKYDGSITGSTMKGTYTASAACSDATGAWQAARK